jgi:hypothetical protein
VRPRRARPDPAPRSAAPPRARAAPLLSPRRGLDCPDFDVLETSGDVQLRRYKRARYVATHVEAASLLAAQIEGTKVRVARRGDQSPPHAHIDHCPRPPRPLPSLLPSLTRPPAHPHPYPFPQRLLAYLAGANEDRWAGSGGPQGGPACARPGAQAHAHGTDVCPRRPTLLARRARLSPAAGPPPPPRPPPPPPPLRPPPQSAKLLPPTVPLETVLFPVDAAAETVEGRFCVALYLPECAQVRRPLPAPVPRTRLPR